MQVEFKDVAYGIGEHRVLTAVNFKVEDGGSLVILGSSGSGKTTILRLLLRLIEPTAGKIIIDQDDLHDMDTTALTRFRKRVAIVFQHGALFDSLTVEENVGYRLMEEGILSSKQIKLIVSQSLEFVGLAGEQKKLPWELSGGMKKRVAIARAIASGAETVLFDEPTAGLDPINANKITQFITHLRDTHSVTSIVVTHDLHHAFEVASQLVVLDAGEIIFDGTVEELKKTRDRRVASFVSPPEEILVSATMDAVMKMSRERLENLK